MATSLELSRTDKQKIARVLSPYVQKESDNYYEQLNGYEHLKSLGMAKEGFDWPYCEHVLTVGYRGSLTEVVQIIGRCTRDSVNKSHAQFANLIAQPDAANEIVTLSVNNMLKAICRMF